MKLPSLVLATIAALVLPAAADAAITITEGANTVTTPRLSWDFVDNVANVERVTNLQWRDSAGTLGANLAKSGGSTCGEPSEFWGQSYGDLDNTPPGPVVAGGTGTWRQRGQRSVELTTSVSSQCGGDPVIPVRTRYSFFDTGTAANKVRIERRWSFTSSSPTYSQTHGLRAYVPRLDLGFNQVVHPNAAGSALVTEDTNGPQFSDSWNKTWVAMNRSGTNDGMVILRDPANQSDAGIVRDNDGYSSSNNSGVTLIRPANGWKQELVETEYLCFYDVQSWPLSTRATSLPPGCSAAAVPLNTQGPTISGTPEAPQPGTPVTADPGTWDLQTGAFGYQWSRCSAASCTLIAGATGQSYTPVAADAGRQLQVSVTATAPGGETDTVQSSLGGLSGKVYEGQATAGKELAGARVQACSVASGVCRAAATDSGGAYLIDNLSPGDYRVAAFPSAASTALPRTRTPVTTVAGGKVTAGQDVVLTLPAPPPPSVTFTGSGSRGSTSTGTPIVHWQQPVVIRYHVDDINAGDVEATITLPDGTMRPLTPGDPVPDPPPGPSDPPGPGGFFPIPVPPLFPDHGPATVNIRPKPKPPATNPGGDFAFPIYIDPSGYVRDIGGAALTGAVVTLLRADSPVGPFEVVPDGSAVMSPMNRKNPDVSDDQGHFGWDVVAGYYKVRAQRSGCHSPSVFDQPLVETGVMVIPPPVTDLDVRLDCAPAAVDTSTGGGGGSSGGGSGNSELPPPAVSGQGSPPPASGTPSAKLLASLVLPKRALKLRVTRSGAFKLTGVKASCPKASTGRCSLTVSAAVGKTALGRATAKLAAGKTVTLTGRLGKSARRRLAKAHRLRVKLSLSAVVPSGGTTKKTLVVTLLPPRR